MAQAPVPQLAPYPKNLGVLPPFYAQQCTSLVMKEKLMTWSGHDFEVKTLDGYPMLKIQGKNMSLSGRKEVMDMQGRHLFTIRRRQFSWNKSFYVEDPSGQEFMSIDGHYSWGGAKSTITFLNASDGRPITLTMKGNFFNTATEIKEEERVVAQVDRKFFSKMNLLGSRQNYLVTMAANVDMAMMVAICVCLDEKVNQRSADIN